MNNRLTHRPLLCSLLLTGAALCISPVVKAEDGFYLTGGGGVAFLEDSNTRDELFALDMFGNVISDTVREKFDTGFLVSGAVGYRIDMDKGAVRIEGELNYQQNDVKELESFGVAASAEGDVSLLAGMFNVYADIDTPSPFVPYLGLGIGAGKLSANEVRAMGVTLADSSDTVITWQFKAGTAFNLGRNVALVAGYRLLGTGKPRFDNPASAQFSYFNESFRNENLLTHVFEGGLRYSF